MKIRLVLRIIAELSYPLPLLLGAGTVFWLEGGIFLAIFYLLTGAVWGMLAVKNPDLLRERLSSYRQEGQPSWDKLLMPLMLLLLLAWLVLMGMDAVRFGWSHVPVWLQLVGFVDVVASSAIIFWIFHENFYLTAVVKIQKASDHQVISSGPYSVVRHPLYATVILLLPSIALLLGSWCGLIMSPVLIFLFILRAILEDRKLQRELQGYNKYMRTVRYRLVPGIW